MKRLILLLAALLFFSQAAAQESTRPPVQEAPGQVPEMNQDTGPRAPAAWPLPFQPSQEIGADSPVSFPTDI